MSGIGSTTGIRPNAVHQVARSGTRPAPQPDDVEAMRGAFAKADGRISPVQGRGPRGDTKLPGKLKPDQLANGASAEAEQRAGAAKGNDKERGRLDPDRDSDRDGQQGVFATAQQSVAPIAVPDMPGPHVDPSAFAQLMTQLWAREKSKGAKEVRVSFGQDAWPATGARLVRNAGGAIDIQLQVADGGAAYDRDTLDSLQSQLASHGLAVGALRVEPGASA